jgi:hypothetical protein
VSSALLFIALSLASYRAWRLLGRDDITAFARQPLPLFINKGLTCPWCAGTWIAIASVYATHRWLVPLGPHWLLWAIAVAAVVGFLGEIDRRLIG